MKLSLLIVACALACCTSANYSPTTYFTYNDPCTDDISFMTTLNTDAAFYGYFSPDTSSPATSTSGTYLPSNLPSCGSSSANYGEWFTLVGTGNTMTVTSRGSDFDTYIKVYSCTYGEVCVNYNDDACYSLDAQVDFPTSDGEVFFIFLTGYADEAGAFQLRVHEGGINCATETTTFSPFTSPDTAFEYTTQEDTQLSYTSPSDACGYYFFNDVDIGEKVTGSTYAVHTTLPAAFPICGSSTATEGRWYTFEGTGETVTVSLAHSKYDTYLKVYYCDGSSVSDGAVCINYNDDCNGLNAAVTFNSQSGSYYYFFITGYMNQMGDYQLLVERGDHGCGGAASTSSMWETTAPYNSYSS